MYLFDFITLAYLFISYFNDFNLFFRHFFFETQFSRVTLILFYDCLVTF